jgi:hypothetical protein
MISEMENYTKTVKNKSGITIQDFKVRDKNPEIKETKSTKNGID